MFRLAKVGLYEQRERERQFLIFTNNNSFSRRHRQQVALSRLASQLNQPACSNRSSPRRMRSVAKSELV